MSRNYTGFWNPKLDYEVGDIVTYYSDSGYSSSLVFYECTANVSSVQNNLGYSGCPLKNFIRPVLSAGSTPEVIDPNAYDPTQGHKIVEITASLMSKTTDWSTYLWYKDPHWVGPNGSNLEVQTAFWALLSSAPTGDVDAADVTTQSFTSTGRTTTSVGAHNPASTVTTSDLVADSEDESEIESENYYISSVQNYKGYWNEQANYQKFDFVRHRETNSFYYAKRDIHNLVNLVEKDVTCSVFPPDTPLVTNHIANLIYFGNNTGFVTEGFAVGQTVEVKVASENIISDGTLLTIAKITEKLMVLAYYTPSGQFREINEEDFPRPVSPATAVNISVKLPDSNLSDPFLDNTFEGAWSKDYFYFDPDYGSSVEYRATNVKYEYGDGYMALRPKGPNSLNARFNLKFSNRGNREANAILHFIENHFGQHEPGPEKEFNLSYDQGIDGFYLDGATLFKPYLNTENLSKKFYCFDVNHSIENEDVHTIDLQIFNNTTSIINRGEYLYLNKAEDYDDARYYNKFDVVRVPENDSFYYYMGERGAQGDPPIQNDNGKITSINQDIWTREFQWFPSVPISVNNDPDIMEHSSKTSAYTQYFPGNKANISLLSFEVTFSKRSESEAYSILHFLESHLGYKSFIFTPPAPYNRKRRFVCQSWRHEYVFKDSHTITARFEQFALGQNTPLDDDEIDAISIDSEKSGPRLASQSKIMMKSSNRGDFVLKNVVKVENIGDEDATNIQLSLVDPSSPFSLSSFGDYNEISGGRSMKSSPNEYDNGESGSFVFEEGSVLKTQDNLGRISSVDFVKEILSSRTVAGESHKSKDFITTKTSLAPGEVGYFEVYLDTVSTQINENKNDLVRITYNTDKESSIEINAAIASDASQEDTITVQIDGVADGAPELIKKTYTVDLYKELHTVNKDNQIDNIIASASKDEGFAAEPQSQEEVDLIMASNVIPGKVALGVKHDGTGFKYNSSGDPYIPTTGITGQAGDILVIVTGDKAFEFNSYESISSNQAASIDGVIIETHEVNTLKNIILQEKMIEELAVQGKNLSDIKTVNFDISGMIHSDVVDLPAIDTGFGYLANQTVNVNIAEGCHVIGKGGRGGNGMFTEGRMDENDGSQTAIPYLTPPQSGENGGPAFLISETNPLVEFNINLPSSGGIFGGGGGGAGGNVNKKDTYQWPISLSSSIDFGGGGGGGAGTGESGNIMANHGSLKEGGQGGTAITASDLYIMQNGSSGGGLGEDGASNLELQGGDPAMFFVSGGKAGQSIIYYNSTNINIVGETASNLKGVKEIK